MFLLNFLMIISVDFVFTIYRIFWFYIDLEVVKNLLVGLEHILSVLYSVADRFIQQPDNRGAN